MIRTDDIGKAIVNAGITWEDGYLRPEWTIGELVDVIAKVLSDNGVIVVTPLDELKHEISMQKYYMARAEMAREHGDILRENKYLELAGALL